MTKAEIITLLVEYFGPLAGTLLTALISWATVEAARWVRSKTRNEKAAMCITRLGHTVNTTVADIQQTLGPAYRAVAEDGHISTRDKRHLKELARNRVKHILTPEVRRGVGIAINDLDNFINAKIEQAVLELKRTAPLEATLAVSTDTADDGLVEFGDIEARP